MVVNIGDERKGEQLVLLTEKPDANRDELVTFAKSEGVSALYVPKTILRVDGIPVLGTGKTDYVTATKMAEAK